MQRPGRPAWSPEVQRELLDRLAAGTCTVAEYLNATRLS